MFSNNKNNSKNLYFGIKHEVSDENNNNNDNDKIQGPESDIDMKINETLKKLDDISHDITVIWNIVRKNRPDEFVLAIDRIYKNIDILRNINK